MKNLLLLPSFFSISISRKRERKEKANPKICFSSPVVWWWYYLNILFSPLLKSPFSPITIESPTSLTRHYGRSAPQSQTRTGRARQKNPPVVLARQLWKVDVPQLLLGPAKSNYVEWMTRSFVVADRHLGICLFVDSISFFTSFSYFWPVLLLRLKVWWMNSQSASWMPPSQRGQGKWILFNHRPDPLPLLDIFLDRFQSFHTCVLVDAHQFDHFLKVKVVLFHSR